MLGLGITEVIVIFAGLVVLFAFLGFMKKPPKDDNRW
jgi:hypothetical protein